MKARHYILKETNWKTAKDTNYQVAILPWGATEAHNYHLPYGTDVIETDYIAAESAKIAWEAGAKVVVLPTVPFGVNTGQLDIKLDINMNPSTQAAVIEDVVVSLAHQDINKLVILNGHGGNDFKQIIRELQPRFPDIFICTLSWYKVLDLEGYFNDTGDHGAEMETSMMMTISPELVLPLSEAGEGKAKKFKLRAIREGWAWAPREWTRVTQDTGIGNPAGATVDKGKRYLTDVIKKIAEFYIELAECDSDNLYE
ncbi:creatininase family protein [candidate division KSB1 bacterium]|nr:creatininase family protein [candidate division KSB1 bacterium]